MANDSFRRSYVAGICFSATRLCFLFSLIFLCEATDISAKTTSFLAGASLRQEYDSNIFRTHQDETEEWNSYFSPILGLSSQGRINKSALRYQPDFIYNNRNSNKSLNHNVFFNSDFTLQRSKLSLSDTLIERKIPYADEDINIEITDKIGSRRYTANKAAAGLTFNFSEKSLISLGYSHYLFDAKNAAQEDFIRQQPYAVLDIYYGPRWQTRVKHSYTYGDFEMSENITTNESDFVLTNHLSSSQRILAHYTFTITDYTGDKPDYKDHTMGLGFGTSSRNLNFLLEGGASIVKRELKKYEKAAFVLLDITGNSGNTSYTFTGKSGFEGRYYTGVDEGLSRYWTAGLSIKNQLEKNLQSRVYANYRDDTYIELTPKRKERILRSGASFTISFFRWYSLILDYTYSRFYADIETDEYTDHRCFVELRAEKEL